MKRLLKFLGITLLLLVLVIVGGVGWLIGTEKGFQQTLALAKRFAPGELEWTSASGKWIGPLELDGVDYSQDNGLQAAVGKLNFDWQPKALLSREVILDQLHVADVEVHLAEAAETEEPASTTPFELPDISLPVAIRLNDVAIDNVALYPAGQDTPIQIDRVALSAQAEQSDISLDFLEVQAPQGQVQLSGSLTTTGDYPMDLATNWQADIGQPEPLQGSGTFVGDVAQLQVEHNIKGMAVADISASLSDLLENPAWDATVEATVPDPESVSELLTGTPSLSLSSSGTPDAYQAQATANVDTTQSGPVTVTADVSGSTQRLDIGSLVATLEENGGELSLAGNVTFDTLNSDIKGQWRDMSWPVLDTPQFSSAEGSIEFAGSPDAFEATLATDVDGEQIPQGQWQLDVKGSSTALETLSLLGQTLDGTITATGSAGWEDKTEWDVDLVTENINPGKQWNEFPGNINLDVNSAGFIDENGPQLTADIKNLSGSLRDLPLTGKGVVRVAGETINIDDLNLTHGATELQANGQVDDQIALDFDLSSPDLADLAPDLAGAVNIAGAVSGSKDEPAIKATATANGITFGEYSLGRLDADVDAGLGASKVSSLSVNASDIVAAGQQVSTLSLTGEGTPSSHSASLSTDTSQGDLSLALAGGYQNDTWTGTLDSLGLEDTAAGTWRLRDAVDITANAEAAKTSSLCLDNSERLGSLCLNGDWNATADSTAVVTISGLSPELAEAYLPEGMVLDTALDGDATATLGANGDLNADVQLRLDPGQLSMESGSSLVEIGLEATTVDVSLTDKDADMQLATAFTELGTLNANGSVKNYSGAGTLDGGLDIDFDDLGLISTLVPQLQQVSGSLQSNLSVGGTMSAPQIDGELALVDFSAEVPETAMLIEDTQLILKGQPDGALLIEGSSTSGGGELDINGTFDPGSQVLALNINGDQYQVANTATMRATLSPALDIGLNDAGMQVNGTVTVPTVYVNANGGNEGIKTVSASSDVVFVSEEGEDVPVAESAASQVQVDVQIVLGDSVEIEAGDFRGRLEGNLRVQQTPGTAPRGTGTINVVNGDYVIYGQTLDMERGRILFSGGPVDNPTLDMQVARNVQEYDVVAGARIQGTVQAPRLELYSEPSMPDASVLSFILLGQPPGTGASYTLGKYLTPDLYVSYGIGLFDAINTFNLRYSLTDKLALEGASGSASSADLIYTIER